MFQPQTKLPKVGTTIFTVMSQLAAEHGAVNLGQGFPDFPVPARLVDALDAAMRAGHMNKRFRTRGGKRERVVADFLIGAHALMQCNGLITRDAGFFRDYFKGLKIIVPKVA